MAALQGERLWRIPLDGAEPVADTPAQMAERIRDDTARYARLVKEAKIAID